MIHEDELLGLAKYPKTFEPLTLGPVEVKNRIYMPPHGQPFWVPIPERPEHTLPGEGALHYYGERAAGGVGLIFFTTVSSPVVGWNQGSPWFDEAIPSYARLADVVHGHGAKIMAELLFGGVAFGTWEPVGPVAPYVGSAVGQDWDLPITRREMTKEEIQRHVLSFARVTRNLREAGWDGVEVHASHGVGIEHFLSPYFNRRDDEYGGSLENRCRFLVESLEAVKSEIGDEMAIGMRINADEMVPGGVDEHGTREILEYLAPKSLLDFVDLDVSVEPEQVHLMTTTFFEPKLHNRGHVAAVSPSARPTMKVIATPGRVTEISEAEQLIASGVVDMVGIGRGQIAEPELVHNALYGRENRSRTCIAANHCLESRRGGFGLGCAINPATAREERWGVRVMQSAPRAMTVSVVGAGPAGLEAARVAALRGHDVTLFDGRTDVGGALSLWASLPGREHLRTLVDWFSNELDALGVIPCTSQKVTATTVMEQKPDVVILATGASYARGGQSGFKQVPIPGSEQKFVHIPEDILEGRVQLSGNIVVLDEEGRHAAAGVAEIAALAGCHVEYVTRSPTPVRALGINSHGGYVQSRLRSLGVRLNTLTYIREIGDHSVTLYDVPTDEERVVNVDSIVLATMRIPSTTLYTQLKGKMPYLYLVGDAQSPRSLHEATYEGHRFARVIGEPVMPASVEEAYFAREARADRPAAIAELDELLERSDSQSVRIPERRRT